jgi:hypothetical protein
MAKFDRLYLDTNVLHQGWPNLSTRVQNALVLADSLKVQVVIPQVTLDELEKHWKENWDAHRAKALSAIAETKKLMNAIAVDPEQMAIPKIPSASDMEGAYQKQVESLLTVGQIEVARLTPRPLDEILRMAIRRDLIFGDEGKNLQDMLIFLSVVDHLREDAAPPASAFVSNDRIFKSEREALTAFAQKAKVEINFYESIDEVATALENFKTDAEKQKIEVEKQTVVRSVKAEMGRLLDWLNSDQPRWPSVTAYGVLYVSTRVRSIGEFIDAVVPPSAGWRIGLTVPLSFSVTASIEFASYVAPGGSGAVAVNAPAPTSLEDIGKLRLDTKVINRVITIEANAVFNGERFAQFEFIDASLKAEPL